jgi:osmotically-inducible protein OsmY
MVRGLVKMVLIAMVVVAVAFFLFGYWSGGSLGSFRVAAPAPAPAATGTSGSIDTSVARERGAELGEKAAKAANSVGESLEEGKLTAKITAKMVLDDMVKARTINVTTNGTTVTLTGTVHSAQERQRAVQLAKETDGVTQVNDQLAVRQP